MSEHWASTLQKLYDSEINFEISTFWDSGFTWKLGDEMNGFVAEGGTFTFGETVEALAHAAHKHYPTSVFHLGREQFDRTIKPLQEAEMEKILQKGRKP